MKKEITKEMTEELNLLLLKMGCCFNFTYVAQGPLSACIEIQPINDKFLNSWILNPSNDFYDFIETFFNSHDIKINSNNTGTIFWSSTIE
jgi:hypothetical protein